MVLGLIKPGGKHGLSTLKKLIPFASPFSLCSCTLSKKEDKQQPTETSTLSQNPSLQRIPKITLPPSPPYHNARANPPTAPLPAFTIGKDPLSSKNIQPKTASNEVIHRIIPILTTIVHHQSTTEPSQSSLVCLRASWEPPSSLQAILEKTTAAGSSAAPGGGSMAGGGRGGLSLGGVMVLVGSGCYVGGLSERGGDTGTL